MGNITSMVANIALEATGIADYEGEKSSQNKEFVRLVTRENVRITVEDIRERGPILQEMEATGVIRIMGAIYDMETGAVECLDG